MTDSNPITAASLAIAFSDGERARTAEVLNCVEAHRNAVGRHQWSGDDVTVIRDVLVALRGIAHDGPTTLGGGKQPVTNVNFTQPRVAEPKGPAVA